MHPQSVIEHFDKLEDFPLCVFPVEVVITKQLFMSYIRQGGCDLKSLLPDLGESLAIGGALAMARNKKMDN